MPTPGIEEFARLLMTVVRDEAIGSCDRDLSPSARGVVAIRWRKSMERGSHEEFAREIIPDCVDDAIFYLLHAIDEGILQLSFTASNGKTVDLTKEGDSEMAGWFAGYAWKERYSKQRFNDDLSHPDRYTGPETP